MGEVGEGKDIWMKSQEAALVHVQGNLKRVTQPQLACLYNGDEPMALGITGLWQGTSCHSHVTVARK